MALERRRMEFRGSSVPNYVKNMKRLACENAAGDREGEYVKKDAKAGCETRSGRIDSNER